MRASEADAIYDQRPNTGDQSATDRNDLQWTGRAMRKCEDAECSLEGFVCATHDHQTKMNNRRSDKQTDHDEYRHKDDKRDGANAHPGQRGESISLARKKTHRLKTERQEKRHYPPPASADQSVDQRFAQATFGFHRSEGQIGFGQHHREGLDKCVEESTFLPVLPG